VGETEDVLSAISSLRSRNRPMALATIVEVKGSTYRRPGARLLVPSEGAMVGNLSGGCLEGEVEGIARSVMAGEAPRVDKFDLTADDEVIWGWGLGCNGAIEVFIEPGDRAAEVADALRLAVEEERPLVVATVLESEAPAVDIGARLLLHPDGRREHGTGDAGADDVIASVAASALERRLTETTFVDVAGAPIRLFLEVLEPPLKLLICGAGHDAIPMAGAGAALGWRVVVADDREAFLSPERFPGARSFFRGDPKDVAGSVDARTYAVVMSHNFLRDKDYLASLLGTEVAYIGMLGPRARLERLLEDLGRDGVHASPGDVAKLYGPAGLDLGGEGPDEIAAAIVGEILAVSRSRPAGHLRDRSGPIHERAEPVGRVTGA
jgi:xanthine dehydrogenase accessory factor